MCIKLKIYYYTVMKNVYAMFYNVLKVYIDFTPVYDIRTTRGGAIPFIRGFRKIILFIHD